MKIVKHCGSYNLSRRTGKPKHIVIHYTGSMASALNNCIYFAGGDRQASADYFIDRDGTIYQYNPDLDSYYSWHCGDGRGRYGITNSQSIGIEHVSDGRDFSPEQIKASSELVQWLQSKYGVPDGNVVRHYDASRKQCPAPYINQAKWNTLHNQLTQGAPKEGWVKDGRGWWYRRANGSYPANGWEKIGGAWYAFDGSGYMLYGWYHPARGEWYWLGGANDGAMKTGWQAIDGKWYYFMQKQNSGLKEGQMVADGWINSNGKEYRLSGDGSMEAGCWVDHARYWVDGNGIWDRSR